MHARNVALLKTTKRGHRIARSGGSQRIAGSAEKPTFRFGRSFALDARKTFDEKVKVRVIRSGVGAITESDVFARIGDASRQYADRGRHHRLQRASGIARRRRCQTGRRRYSLHSIIYKSKKKFAPR
jgi:hypothetical protein